LKLAAVTSLVVLATLGMIGSSNAVPSFARQTGQECPACHVSWPELTPYGRFFKLTGYTIGKNFVSSEGFNYMPMAAMAQASVTHLQNNSMIDPDTGDTVSVMQRQNSLVWSGGSLFFATKLGDYVGAFVQWTYDNLATVTNGTLGGHSAMDNTDIRAAYKYSPRGPPNRNGSSGSRSTTIRQCRIRGTARPPGPIPIQRRRWHRHPRPRP